MKRLFLRILVFIGLKIKEMFILMLKGIRLLALAMLFLIVTIIIGLGSIYLLGWLIDSMFPFITIGEGVPTTHEVRLTTGFFGFIGIAMVVGILGLLFSGCCKLIECCRTNWKKTCEIIK